MGRLACVIASLVGWLTVTATALADPASDAGAGANGAGTKVGAEVPFDTPDAGALAIAPEPTFFSEYYQATATAATLNGLFYVAWADQRDALTQYPPRSELYVARVDPATGRPVASDVHGLQVTHGATVYQGGVAIASDGAAHLALSWMEATFAGIDIHFLLLDAATALPVAGAGSDGTVVYSSTATLNPPQLSWSGQSYVLTWNQTAIPGASFALRLDARGVPFPSDSAGISLPASASFPAFVCDPSGANGCLYVSSDATNALAATFFDPATATVTMPAPLPTSASDDSRTAAVAGWDGKRFVVAASAGGGVFVTPASVGAQFTLESFYAATIAFDGTRYVLAGDDLSTFLPNVDTAGSAQTYPDLLQSTSLQEQLVGSIAGTSLLAGSTADFDLAGLFMVRLNDATGKAPAADVEAGVAGVALSTDVPFEAYSSVASDNAGHVWGAWGDGRAETTYLKDAINGHAAFYGGVIDATTGKATAEVHVGDDYNYANVTAAASDGTAGLVAVGAPDAIAFTKLSSAGAIVATRTLSISNNGIGQLALAYGGGEYLVVMGLSDQLSFQLLDAETLTPKFSTWQALIRSSSPLSSDPYALAVTFGSDGFYVVWSRGVNGYSSEIDGARVSVAGVTLDPDGVAFCEDVQASFIAIAPGGGHYLVAWADEDDDLSTFDIRGMLIGFDGSVVTSPTLIAGGVGDQSSPSIADTADGVAFQVVWQDSRNGNFDIYGTRVQYDGSVRQVGGQAITTSSDDERNPQVTRSAPGQMFLTYERSAASPRLYSRTLTTGATAGACSADEDCASLVCADGYCCDRPCSGVCETCARVPGTCSSVVSASDPDSCTGASTCNASGACVTVAGKSCGSAAACESGFCVDGLCCDSACDGACESCSATPGVCTVSAAGSTGNKVSCVPYICDGKSATCPNGCASDTECVRPYTCSALGTCTLSSGSSCVDSETSKSANGLLSTCSPFVCARGECGQSCSSISDCAAGFVCDAAGRCVSPAFALEASGCDATPGGRADDNGSSGGAYGGTALAVFFTLSQARIRRRRMKGARR